MPELPEVETVANDLQRWVAGATIRDATVHWDRTIRHPQPPELFAAEISGATIRRVGRRAKTVLVHLADGRVMTIALRMTGALIVAAAGTPPDPYARVVFALEDGRELRYRDVRKFGRIGLWPGGGLRSVGAGRGARSRKVAEGSKGYRIGEVFSGHGPEPMTRSFTAARFAERLSRRSGRLKTLLLDQSFIAGVGNIYADEALWRARLHPLRPADTLTPDEVRRLHRVGAQGAAAGDREPWFEHQRLRRRGRRARRQRRAAHGLSAHRPAMLPMRTPDQSHRRRAAQHPLLPALPARADTIGGLMKVIGLTGNIGCGKSTVAAMLREMGAATIDADVVAREIRHNDAEARAEIVRRFGTYEADELSEIVFWNPDDLRDLEAILHPRVRGAIRARLAELEQAGADVAVVEVIKLLESPLADACDAVWVVRCDEADALRRLAESRGMDEDAARSRIGSQSSQEEKIAAADTVIDGSADLEETRRQVERSLAALRETPA